MSGNGQWLEGAVPANWTGGVTIKFAPGIAGIQAPSTVYNARISNLELDGQRCYSARDPKTMPDWTRESLVGPGPDGIQLGGGEPRLDNVWVQCFERHGIYVSGDSTIWHTPPSQPDFWRFDRVSVNSNRGDGIFVKGADSNAGVGTMIDARANGLFGVQDNAQLGNTWIGIGTHTNHNDCCVSGAASSLSSILGRAGTVTVVTTSPVVGLVPDGWVTIAGTANYDGTFKISGFTDASHFQFDKLGDFDRETEGAAARSSTASIYGVWDAAGAYGGCIGGSGQYTTFIQPYVEANQGVGARCIRTGSNVIIYGSNAGVETYGANHASSPSQFLSTPYGPKLFTNQGFSIRRPYDGILLLDLQAGTTANQPESIRFLGYDGAERYHIRADSGSFSFYDAHDRSNFIYKNQGGSLVLRGTNAAGDVEFNRGSGHNVNFYGGSTKLVASVDSSGKGIFDGGIQTPALSGISNTAVVKNLNAELLDGRHASDFLVLGTGARPACDASHHFQFWTVAGGHGVKDTVEVCAKDERDSYAWQILY